ncbi:MAG: NTP transferase domain-containing protein [Desulfobacterales bacterium]|nr:MAG: NTP transferase domain-containing protein [Desulfobacterales bacterium]
MDNQVAVIILAAGLGTRMKSDKAKVLHEILGKPMVLYVVETARAVAGDDVILVVGNQAEEVRRVVATNGQSLFAFQDKQLGTGHAVLCALPHIPDHCANVLILCGDVPLITAETLCQLIQDHEQNQRDITVVAVEIDNPTGYGRILIDENRQVYGIVEESDANGDQKKIRTINTGIYCVKKDFLKSALEKIRPDNSQGEFYLTDIIQIGYSEKKLAGVFMGQNEKEFQGVNTWQELQRVEALMRTQLTNIA